MRPISSWFASRDWIALAFLILIAALSHPGWFSVDGVVSFADWVYWPQAAVMGIPMAWGGWVDYFDFGSPNSMAFFSPFKALWWGGVELGISPAWVQRITILIPAAVAPFASMFLLIRRMGGASLPALVAALFYGSTTYLFVRQIGGHLLVALDYGLAPLFVLCLIHAANSSKRSAWIYLGAFSALMSMIDVRIFMIVAFMSALVVVIGFRYVLHGKIGKILLAGAVFFGLSAYWILPALSPAGHEEIATVMFRGLFGDHLFDMTHALALSDSAWTGERPNFAFQKQSVLAYEWLTTLIALLGLATGIRAKDAGIRKATLVAAIVAIIGISLTKQSSPPLLSLYEWLYLNFPGFALFREASKFYLLTSFGYAILVAVAFSRTTLKQKKSVHLLSGSILAGALLLVTMNLWPLVAGTAGGTLVARPIPEAITQLHAFLGQDQEFGRVLWLPGSGRWRYFTAVHPDVSAYPLAKALDVDVSEDSRRVCQNLASTPGFGEKLSGLGIKYVIVPMPLDGEREDDPFTYYDNRARCVTALERGESIRRVNLSLPQIDIFEVEHKTALVRVRGALETETESAVSARTTRLSSGIYRIEIPNISTELTMDIATTYNRGWYVVQGPAELPEIILHEMRRLFGVSLQGLEIARYPTPEGMLRFAIKSNKPIQLISVYSSVQVYFILGVCLSIIVLCISILMLILEWARKNVGD